MITGLFVDNAAQSTHVPSPATQPGNTAVAGSSTPAASAQTAAAKAAAAAAAASGTASGVATQFHQPHRVRYTSSTVSLKSLTGVVKVRSQIRSPSLSAVASPL